MMSSRLKGLPVRSPGLEGPLYFLLTIICRNIGRRPNSTTFTQSVLLKHLFLQNSSDACSRSFREIILTSSQPFSSNYHQIFSVIHLAPSPGNLPCIHPAHINMRHTQQKSSSSNFSLSTTITHITQFTTYPSST